jgi:hypothetical protein
MVETKRDDPATTFSPRAARPARVVVVLLLAAGAGLLLVVGFGAGLATGLALNFRQAGQELDAQRQELEERRRAFEARVAAEETRKKREQQKRETVFKLRDLAQAMLAHHDVYHTFPTFAAYSNDGKPLLSWRVALLPFIGEDKLHSEFHLDEPWDSPHNKGLLTRMPQHYAAPAGLGTKDATLTHYQVLTGPDALFDRNQRRRITDVTDGTSNTILLAETERAVPWTKPEDLPFDLKGPLPKLGGLFEDGFNIAFADGSAHFVRNGSPAAAEANVRALITYQGGEVVVHPND